MGKYTESDAAKETDSSKEEASKAWEQAEKDDAGGTPGKTLEEAAPSEPREETSLEDLKEVEESQD